MTRLNPFEGMGTDQGASESGDHDGTSRIESPMAGNFGDLYHSELPPTPTQETTRGTSLHQP